MSLGSLYSDVRRFRHLARCARLAMVAAGAMALGGCGVMTIPGMPIDSGLQTSSIRSHGPLLAAARISDGVMPADWEAVRRAVVGIPTDKSAEAVEWSNPSTGSEGTILSADSGGFARRRALSRLLHHDQRYARHPPLPGHPLPQERRLLGSLRRQAGRHQVPVEAGTVPRNCRSAPTDLSGALSDGKGVSTVAAMAWSDWNLFLVKPI